MASTGLVFFLIVPIGAFVEIDEKVIQKAKFRQSGRVLAGGPGSNVVVALITLGLLLLLVGGLVPAQFNGVNIGGVVSSSPAYNLYQAHEISARRPNSCRQWDDCSFRVTAKRLHAGDSDLTNLW